MLDTKTLIKLDKYISKITDEEIIPAINLSIISNDGNWMCSHGKKQILPASSPNSLDTLFDISSLTMPYISATLILKLAENNDISLEDRVKDYIKEFKANTTIIECLTHTSGIDLSLGSLNLNKEDLLKKVYNLKINKSLKGIYNESWINYFILGLLIERLKGDIEQYALEVMYGSLNMKRTYFNPDNVLKSNCACSGMLDNLILCGDTSDKYAQLFDGKTGHSGCFVTLQDITHYVTSLINKGKYRQNKFFDKSQLDLIFDEYKDTNHTLSWIKGKQDNLFSDVVSEQAIYYVSDTGCAILVEPKKGYGIVFLSNPYHLKKDVDNFNNILHEIFKLSVEAIKP